LTKVKKIDRQVEEGNSIITRHDQERASIQASMIAVTVFDSSIRTREEGGGRIRTSTTVSDRVTLVPYVRIFESGARALSGFGRPGQERARSVRLFR
jgi:hypothetical protein